MSSEGYVCSYISYDTQSFAQLQDVSNDTPFYYAHCCLSFPSLRVPVYTSHVRFSVATTFACVVHVLVHRASAPPTSGDTRWHHVPVVPFASGSESFAGPDSYFMGGTISLCSPTRRLTVSLPIRYRQRPRQGIYFTVGVPNWALLSDVGVASLIELETTGPFALIRPPRRPPVPPAPTPPPDTWPGVYRFQRFDLSSQAGSDLYHLIFGIPLFCSFVLERSDVRFVLDEGSYFGYSSYPSAHYAVMPYLGAGVSAPVTLSYLLGDASDTLPLVFLHSEPAYDQRVRDIYWSIEDVPAPITPGTLLCSGGCLLFTPAGTVPEGAAYRPVIYSEAVDLLSGDTSLLTGMPNVMGMIFVFDDSSAELFGFAIQVRMTNMLGPPTGRAFFLTPEQRHDAYFVLTPMILLDRDPVEWFLCLYRVSDTVTQIDSVRVAGPFPFTLFNFDFSYPPSTFLKFCPRLVLVPS